MSHASSPSATIAAAPPPALFSCLHAQNCFSFFDGWGLVKREKRLNAKQLFQLFLLKKMEKN